MLPYSKGIKISSNRFETIFEPVEQDPEKTLKINLNFALKEKDCRGSDFEANFQGAKTTNIL